MSAGSCPPAGELQAYASAPPAALDPDGEAGSAVAPDTKRAAIEAHAKDCAECRSTLVAFGMLNGPETAAEKALLDRLAFDRATIDRVLEDRAQAPAPNRARPRWARFSAIGAASAGLAAAAAALLVITLHSNNPAQALAEVQDGARPLEAAFSDLPYAPYRPQRGNGLETRFDRPLSKLLEAKEKLRPGAARMLATLYTLRNGAGDAARADRLLAEAGGDADTENDRAVLFFAKGDFLAALEMCDLALEQDGRHRAARFNRALLIERLGFAGPAADAFEALAKDDEDSPWAAEARERAARLRSPAERNEIDPAETRRAALVALLAAGTPGELARARALIAALPKGLGTDLQRMGDLAGSYSTARLEAHGKLFARYQALRGETLSGSATLAAMRLLITDASNDPLALVPVLQLAAFRYAWRDEHRAAQELQLRALRVCQQSGCDAINEAIAADELAEAAGRDADFATAHRLQDRAEARFASVAAEQQLGELEQKRAHLLIDEGRLDEATRASIRALRILAPIRTPAAVAAEAVAASCAASVAQARQEPRAALELHRAGLALLVGTDAADSSADLASAVAVDVAELGRPAEAQPILREELKRQLAAGHRVMAGQIRATAAAIDLQQGDTAAALEASSQALTDLAGAESAEGSDWRDQLARARVLRARALIASSPGGAQAAAAARTELQAAVESAVQAAQNSTDIAAPIALARRGTQAAIELALLGARAGTPAAELLLPLDSLRSAVFRSDMRAPMTASWPAKLSAHSCLVALLPAEEALVRLAITPDASEAKLLATTRAQLDKLISNARSSRPTGAVPDPRAPTAAESALASALYADLPAACSAANELWLWVEAPLDGIDASALPLPGALAENAAVGFVTSLSRLVAPEPIWPPPAGSALFIDGAEPSGEDGESAPALPAADRERASLRAALGTGLLELTGQGLTPSALLARLSNVQFLHAAVHGSTGTGGSGGALQLSGELGRLSARELAAAHLLPGSRVVLSACHAAPGESGLAIALARAGAFEIASAEGAIDDEAAASWSAAFYPALARGLSFTQANHAALRAQPESGPRAWFVITR